MSEFKNDDYVRLKSYKSEFYNKATLYMESDNMILGEVYRVCSLNNNGFEKWDKKFIKLYGKSYNLPIDCFEKAEKPFEGNYEIY